MGLIMWAVILLLPWRPWSTRERLDAHGCPDHSDPADLSDITALIPARNEAHTIKNTVRALTAQGTGLHVVVVDDQSTDGTADILRSVTSWDLTQVQGEPLPPGWTGKVWALAQGIKHVNTKLTLLLDADIELDPGILAAMKAKVKSEGISFLSLMVALRMESFWEKLLMPAFVYFFKVLYPFHLSNDPRIRQVAAGAGGCILVETEVINRIGGFYVVRDMLIDDCALASHVKRFGLKTWIGLTCSARSLRVYDSLQSIWRMVARNAFTELKYSILRLLICTLLLVAAFVAPLAGVLLPEQIAKAVAVTALLLMAVSYYPTLSFYQLPWWRAFTLPLTGLIFLAMTWSSAVQYWRGRRSQWKGRVYAAHGMRLDSR